MKDQSKRCRGTIPLISVPGDGRERGILGLEFSREGLLACWPTSYPGSRILRSLEQGGGDESVGCGISLCPADW